MRRIVRLWEAIRQLAKSLVSGRGAVVIWIGVAERRLFSWGRTSVKVERYGSECDGLRKVIEHAFHDLPELIEGVTGFRLFRTECKNKAKDRCRRRTDLLAT
jgi:hypothetical protein